MIEKVEKEQAETAEPKQLCDMESGDNTAKKNVSSVSLEARNKKIDAETTQSASPQLDGILEDKQIFEKISKGVVDLSYHVSDVVAL